MLVVEGEDRRLRAWDVVHPPPWTQPRDAYARFGEIVIEPAPDALGTPEP